eukprot:1404327-Prymnesium_polylepis.1
MTLQPSKVHVAGWPLCVLRADGTRHADGACVLRVDGTWHADGHGARVGHAEIKPCLEARSIHTHQASCP